jgi:threonine aldolase
MPVSDGHQFASDNTAGICPEAWNALLEANHEAEISYAADRWTRRLQEQLRDIFEIDCQSFLVFNGTAANSLALAQLCRPFESAICHHRAHIQTDECGAPEFFSGGGKLLTVPGENGKLDLDAVAVVLGQHLDVHSTKVRALSATQSTESGTVYALAELEAISALAKKHSLALHMDGARFANAVASLGCKPREITWERGVDVLCFGGTKNGLAAGEVVVFFQPELARDFDFRLKQGGQLASKSRFLAAPWSALLSDDLWLKNARHANEMAERLEMKLAKIGLTDLAFPRQANAVFPRLPGETAKHLLARGWHFYNFVEPGVYRLMCSWATTEEQLDALVADCAAARNQSTVASARE